MYIYINIGILCFDFSVTQCSIEMNYMSYVYYVEWMITKNGEAFKLLLPLILAIEITL